MKAMKLKSDSKKRLEVRILFLAESFSSLLRAARRLLLYHDGAGEPLSCQSGKRLVHIQGTCKQRAFLQSAFESDGRGVLSV